MIPTDIIFEDIVCHYCKPGIREFVINFNGDIFPCTNLVNKDFKIGNLFNDSDILKKLTQQSINFNHIFNTINRLRPLNDKHCRNCKVNLFCWECPSRFQSIKRNSNKLNEFCEFKKRRLYKEIWGESI
ncbi:SPASM domain-containing protein [Staphylococcus epidermidis]|uniref:SPASM domain-containing protein n=1 Tax=Staphylococcus epidermidis TaxID=1282 RepID=UPI000494D143|nr:SPASM domain-containing protein [Staphylococcus epidermidis]